MSRGAAALRFLIRTYQLVLAPVLGPACRYHPSCSEYARQAVARFGAARGAWLAARRVARCHPWCEGGPDPVPDALPSAPGRASGAERAR